MIYVGHPDLATGACYSASNGITYISVTEAIFKQYSGEPNVEVKLQPDEQDEMALKGLKIRARLRWDNDKLPDGWTKPIK